MEEYSRRLLLWKPQYKIQADKKVKRGKQTQDIRDKYIFDRYKHSQCRRIEAKEGCLCFRPNTRAGAGFGVCVGPRVAMLADTVVCAWQGTRGAMRNNAPSSGTECPHFVHSYVMNHEIDGRKHVQCVLIPLEVLQCHVCERNNR